ncbi:MAG: hypothetical protein J6D34_10590, partial [Atopobiaceae bacterium]|nr:hypothetical protein [Atopobiaceae bacterium]
FGQAYQETDERLGSQLNSYLLRWERDYAIYHGIPQAMRASQEDELGSAVLTLMRAEHAQLRAAKREPKIANDQARGNAPADDQVFHALGNAGTYHICESRLAKDDPELVSAVALDVFSELVMHCSKRRKTDYVEGLFGYALRTPYTMFAAAVFYDPDPHPDCTVTLNERESFTCKNGHWYRLLACEARNRSAELGLALHAVDYELRKALDYAYPLKERKVPKYLTKMVRSAIAKRLEERAEAERRRITIDLSKLSGIRAAAAVTQEALLTDEERGEEPAPEPTTTAAEPMQMQLAAETPAAQDSQTQEAAAAQAGEPASPGAPAAPVATGTFANPTPATTTEGPLTPLQIRFLTGLMDGTPVHELLSPTDPFPSVVADSINETFFDLVGDAVIEFDGDTPLIVEDYLDDIREVLQA